MFKLIKITLIVLLSTQLITCQDQTITATIYADNIFEFYANGALVKKDPLDFTPHNAVKFTFTVTKGVANTYAIKASDYATTSGYEYINNNPQLGDGALRMIFSDGTVSNNKWKCFTTSFGPTDASNTAGCSATNLAKCAIQLTAEPTDWTSKTFDDSKWTAATIYTEAEAGWGMTPNYSGGMCGTLTDPLTRGTKSPSSIATTADECLDPRVQSWGTSQFIWQADLKRDNTILCRYTTTGSSSVTPTPTPSSTGSEGDLLQMRIIKTFLLFLIFLCL